MGVGLAAALGFCLMHMFVRLKPCCRCLHLLLPLHRPAKLLMCAPVCGHAPYSLPCLQNTQDPEPPFVLPAKHTALPALPSQLPLEPCSTWHSTLSSAGGHATVVGCAAYGQRQSRGQQAAVSAPCSAGGYAGGAGCAGWVGNAGE